MAPRIVCGGDDKNWQSLKPCLCLVSEERKHIKERERMLKATTRKKQWHFATKIGPAWLNRKAQSTFEEE